MKKEPIKKKKGKVNMGILVGGLGALLIVIAVLISAFYVNYEPISLLNETESNKTIDDLGEEEKEEVEDIPDKEDEEKEEKEEEKRKKVVVIKNETTVVPFTIKNTENTEKKYSINLDVGSEETPWIEIKEREIRIAPYSNETIDIYVTPGIELEEGVYEIDIGFSDEEGIVAKKVVIEVRDRSRFLEVLFGYLPFVAAGIAVLGIILFFLNRTSTKGSTTTTKPGKVEKMAAKEKQVSKPAKETSKWVRKEIKDIKKRQLPLKTNFQKTKIKIGGF
ncbi:hypothetical protein ACFL0W_05250 [Nanoarchaeota archaeon]